MAVKIRLRRVGAKKQPSYRVVIADSRSPRDGRFIEVIGFYNPRTKPTTITIDEEKARKWLGNGARPTDTVASLLYRAGIADLRTDRQREGAANRAAAEPAAAATTPTPAAQAPAAPVASAVEEAPAEPEPSVAAAEEAPVEPEAAEVEAVEPAASEAAETETTEA